MAHYQIMAWHGIPTGVKAEDDQGQVRENLPLRFQTAVDAVATATGRTGTTSYLAGYQWSESVEREGAAREVAAAVAAELIQAYPPRRVKAMRLELEQSLAPE